MDPVTFPAPAGAKTALKVALLPGVIVNGVLSPVILKPVPETLPCEIVRFAVPPLVSVIVCELVFPTVTFPKGALDGIAPISGWVPVPVRAMLIGELGELLETEMLPLALPAEVGRNCAVKLELCPGWIVRPAAKPLMVKAVPLTLA